MKKCSKCNEVKSFCEFCKCNKSLDSLQSQCKSCKKQSIYSSPSYKNRKYKSTEKSRKTRLEYFHKTKVARNISRRIRQSLNGNRKSNTWEILVGYSLIDLKSHLESKFTELMNWANYGSYWHIDHIIPICSFDIQSDKSLEFKECWALTNLQPLSAKDNLRKSGKYN